ncbi:MAG: transcription elongation factor GreA [Bacilli bacterium]|nr:transcription elongation factor GreA [Bacilli bacterium]
MNNKYQLTPNGLEELKKELEKLVNEDKPKIIEQIKDARAQGDLSENADYDAARDEQARVELRINELEKIIQNAVIIKNSNKSNFGKKVVVIFDDSGEEETFEIVGSLETNPLEGRISNESPLGIAILNKDEGDEVILKTETDKEHKIKIVKIFDR